MVRLYMKIAAKGNLAAIFLAIFYSQNYLLGVLSLLLVLLSPLLAGAWLVEEAQVSLLSFF